ncbi:MAG: peptide-methionine (S)-S-oxide reductase MsrA [Pseudomonadota bacterium]
MAYTQTRLVALAGAAAVAATLIVGGIMPGAQPSTAQEVSDIDAAQTAIFAGGCFWCVEKDFDHVAGVLETTSGYIGGRLPNPTYQTHGANGDLEAVKVVFDPEIVSYEDLASTFLRTVDVTDDGGQFCDRGNSYRTAFFVLNQEQRAIAEAEIAEGSELLDLEIVTPIMDATTFWPAEEFHQNYYAKNPLRYQFYRTSCGRDRTVKRVWGDAAYQGVDKSS